MGSRTVVEPAAVGIKRQQMVFEALRLLIPFDLQNERKIRIGEPGDGSYVLLDRLRGNSTCSELWHWPFNTIRVAYGGSRPRRLDV